MAKTDDFRIFYVLSELAVPVSKPLVESLYSETCRSETRGDRFGCEAFVKEQNAFLTPLFDVYQSALAPFQ